MGRRTRPGEALHEGRLLPRSVQRPLGRFRDLVVRGSEQRQPTLVRALRASVRRDRPLLHLRPLHLQGKPQASDYLRGYEPACAGDRSRSSGRRVGERDVSTGDPEHLDLDNLRWVRDGRLRFLIAAIHAIRQHGDGVPRARAGRWSPFLRHTGPACRRRPCRAPASSRHDLANRLEHPGERRRDLVRLEGRDEQRRVPEVAAAVLEPAAELRLDRTAAPVELVLEAAERL